jgi:predicted dehydrogenase
MNLVIVGLGIGSVHLEQAIKLNLFDNIITIDNDPSKNPTYSDIGFNQFLESQENPHFNMVIICLPNFLHRRYIDLLAPYSEVIIVEKPGLSSVEEWNTVLEEFPDTRIVMAKNNMFRNTIERWREEYNKSSIINCIWLNKNRVPFPGGWFTNKEKAWGGVSYDLLPHLIHIAISAGSGKISDPIYSTRFQKWNMADVQDTEYGVVNQNNPIYNVDDHCRISFMVDDKKINCVAAWKSDRIENDKAEIQFIQEEHNIIIEQGLCPNAAYGRQMQFFLNMTEEQYKVQVQLDKFVLNCIENIENNAEETFYDDLDLDEEENNEGITLK